MLQLLQRTVRDVTSLLISTFKGLLLSKCCLQTAYVRDIWHSDTLCSGLSNVRFKQVHGMTRNKSKVTWTHTNQSLGHVAEVDKL